MLLRKFVFIQPENRSGYEPPNGLIPVIKKDQFHYVNLGSIIGDAPKCMIALYEYERGGKIKKSSPLSWKKYIAKSASKWYPNESITEHLLNRLGEVFKLNMANSKIRRINNQIWFLSEFFIKDDFSLYHGADLYANQLDGDIEFVEQVQNDNKLDDQHYFTIQFVKESLSKNFPNDCHQIFEDFIKMILFDGLVGNNDRHSYNWGVITSVKKNHKVSFAPIYDTARGLHWNISEENVKRILQSEQKNGSNPQIEKYVVNSRPKIGWEGEGTLSHFELLRRIYETETGISKQNFVTFVEQCNLEECLCVIDNEFGGLFSFARKELIKKTLTLRFQIIQSITTNHDTVFQK